MPIELKRDPYLWAFAGLIVLVTGALIWHGDVTFKEGGAFIMGALAMPALFGKKDDGSPPPPPPPPSSDVIPVVNTPIVAVLMMGLAVAACASATPQEKAAAADSTYAGEQLKCATTAPTLEASRACRAEVRARWGVDGGVR